MTNTYQRLLVPVSGASSDARAISLAGDLVQRSHASVTLIYVVEVPQSMPLDSELPDQIDRGESILHHAEQAARSCISQKLENVSTDLLQARAAGIEEADAFVALTNGDNRNIMAAQVARHIFQVQEVVCRIYDPVREDAYRRLGLTTVCPTTTIAAQVLEYVLSAVENAPSALSAEQ